jgi:branched-chain amino acid transport system substrate-binding protein
MRRIAASGRAIPCHRRGKDGRIRSRRRLLAAAAIAAVAPDRPRPGARGRAPIRVGEINSYSTIPQFLVPYRKGWELAVEEVNAAGGLLGRRVEVIARDDAGKPDDAVRHATELVASEKVDLLAGTFLSNVGLAVADFALRNRRCSSPASR